MPKYGNNQLWCSVMLSADGMATIAFTDPDFLHKVPLPKAEFIILEKCCFGLSLTP